MVLEEFKTNQAFLYPEEYDLFDQEKEHALKKNFTNEAKDMNDKSQNWKVPNFQNEQTVLENFTKKDMYDKKDYERYMRVEV